MIRTVPLLIFNLFFFLLLSDSFPQSDIQLGKKYFKKEESKADPNQRNYQQAIEVLEKAVKDSSNSQEAFYFLGLCYDREALGKERTVNRTDPVLTQKASDCFKRVIDINPNYSGEVWMFGPYMRIISTWTSLAIRYYYEGNKDSAFNALKQPELLGAYLPVILDYGKNLLISCKMNAILFTHGDMDTFVLWYLQAIQNFRSDVTVINLGMLNITWYAKAIKNNYLFGKNNAYMRLPDRSVDLQTIKMYLGENADISVTDSVLAAYNVKDGNVLKSKKITWYLPPTGYRDTKKFLTLQDIFVKEIIEANEWKRSIYFASTTPENSRLGLSDYLRLEGLNYQFIPLKRSTESVYVEKELLSIAIMLQRRGNDKLFQSPFFFSGLKSESVLYEDAANKIIQNYRNLFTNLALGFKLTGDIDKSHDALSQMEIVFPYNRFKADYKFLYIVAMIYHSIEQERFFTSLVPQIEREALERIEKFPKDYVEALNPYKILVDLYTVLEKYDKGIEIMKKLMILVPDNPNFEQHLKNLEGMRKK